MGFFKRFLSLGSSKHRKNKKKQPAANSRVDAEGRIVADNGAQDLDTSANRLLRSSSTKFSVMCEFDYTALPPLHLLTTGTPPLSPSPSLVTVATTPGLQRSGTYVVKVHGRTTHSRTEFPRANPPLSPTKSHRTRPSPVEQAQSPALECDDEEGQDEGHPPVALKEVNFTPKDTSRLYKLRRDPSVASLLNLYDEQGCLDSAIFENYPTSPSPISAPQEGRDQTKHSGSTFRQLLGEPEPAYFRAAAEGDISWAERFLE
ncbi:hypothetical protein C8Q80DRAFT_1110396 [Daedaleopsis nitida]|nr:hypothetical protein C8Q80DRAFT_1110396 [Daedaleopsis nitida]